MNKFCFTIRAREENHIAIKYLCFNDIYHFCIHKERHLITLVVFFRILHIVDFNNSLFSRNNDVFLLIFGSSMCARLPKFASKNFRCYSDWARLSTTQCNNWANKFSKWLLQTKLHNVSYIAQKIVKIGRIA
jgi:hypothetical protein